MLLLDLTSTYIPTPIQTRPVSQYLATHCSSLYTFLASLLTYTLALTHWSTGWANTSSSKSSSKHVHPLLPPNSSLLLLHLPIHPRLPVQSPSRIPWTQKVCICKKKKRFCTCSSLACLHLLAASAAPAAASQRFCICILHL